MRSRLTTAFLVFSLVALIGTIGCAPSIKDGYLNYSPGRLMFKIPPGSWERVKMEEGVMKIPEPFDRFTVGKQPKIALAAAVRPAVILIWVDHTSRDYSKRLVDGFNRLETFLQNRQKAAQSSKTFKYFEYMLLNDLIAAKTDLAAQSGDFEMRGHGQSRIYFHKGETYYYYFELQADAEVFDAVKEEFTEALKETHGD
jgi:hypothetical protein